MLFHCCISLEQTRKGGLSPTVGPCTHSSAPQAAENPSGASQNESLKFCSLDENNLLPVKHRPNCALGYKSAEILLQWEVGTPIFCYNFILYVIFYIYRISYTNRKFMHLSCISYSRCNFCDTFICKEPPLTEYPSKRCYCRRSDKKSIVFWMHWMYCWVTPMRKEGWTEGMRRCVYLDKTIETARYKACLHSI